MKGMILVRGPYDETSGFPDLPFVVNWSMSFPGVYKRRVHSYMPIFYASVSFYCVLLVQGKTRGVRWSIGWRRPVSRKFRSCWRFPSGNDITKSFLP